MCIKYTQTISIKNIYILPGTVKGEKQLFIRVEEVIVFPQGKTTLVGIKN